MAIADQANRRREGAKPSAPTPTRRFSSKINLCNASAGSTGESGLDKANAYVVGSLCDVPTLACDCDRKCNR